MRSLHKSWDNRKEHMIKGRYNGWTRRVRWLQNTDATDIRLEFENENGVTNKLYTNKEDAQKDYDAFRDIA